MKNPCYLERSCVWEQPKDNSEKTQVTTWCLLGAELNTVESDKYTGSWHL